MTDSNEHLDFGSLPIGTDFIQYNRRYRKIGDSMAVRLNPDGTPQQRTQSRHWMYPETEVELLEPSNSSVE